MRRRSLGRRMRRVNLDMDKKNRPRVGTIFLRGMECGAAG